MDDRGDVVVALHAWLIWRLTAHTLHGQDFIWVIDPLDPETDTHRLHWPD